jgi:hypothetical protein
LSRKGTQECFIILVYKSLFSPQVTGPENEANQGGGALDAGLIPGD